MSLSHLKTPPKSSITRISLTPCLNSPYIQPYRMHYHENGMPRTWDCIKSLDSVAIVLYHRGFDALLFVRQFRPAVFIRTHIATHNTTPQCSTPPLSPKTPFSESSTFFHELNLSTQIENASDDLLQRSHTYELCAGLVDKSGKSLEQIAKEEVLEECGYEVRDLRLIGEFATAVGHSGAKQGVFYASIDECDKRTPGGGIDTEVIETIFVKVSEIEEFLNDTSFTKPPALGFGVMWFLHHYPTLKHQAP